MPPPPPPIRSLPTRTRTLPSLSLNRRGGPQRRPKRYLLPHTTRLMLPRAREIHLTEFIDDKHGLAAGRVWAKPTCWNPGGGAYMNSNEPEVASGSARPPAILSKCRLSLSRASSLFALSSSSFCFACFCSASHIFFWFHVVAGCLCSCWPSDRNENARHQGVGRQDASPARETNGGSLSRPASGCNSCVASILFFLNTVSAREVEDALRVHNKGRRSRIENKNTPFKSDDFETVQVT